MRGAADASGRERPLAGALAGAVTLGLLVAACVGEGIPGPDVIARIGDRPLSHTDFEAYLADNSVDSPTDLASDVLSSLLDQFVREELLRQWGIEEQGLPADVGRRQAALELIELAEAEAGGLSAGELAAYRREHAQEFVVPDRLWIRQILVEDDRQLAAVAADLEAGIPFEEAARRHSVGPAAETGGDQGLLAADDLPSAFADTIVALEPGEVSPPVEVEYGYHLFQLVERLPGRALERAEAEEEIRERMVRERSDRLLEALVERAAGRYNVVVFRRNLPFNYHGSFPSAPRRPVD